MGQFRHWNIKIVQRIRQIKSKADIYRQVESEYSDTSGKYMKIYRKSGNTKMDNIDL